MKKIIAMLLCVLMLGSFAFAESGDDVVIDSQLDFDITLDVPEGYTLTRDDTHGFMIVFITPDDPTGTEYVLSADYSEDFAGFTLNPDLTEEQIQQATELLTMDYENPVVTTLQTKLGTYEVLIVEEGSEMSYAELVTIYKGYFCNMAFGRPEGKLEQADIDLALEILSSAEIVEHKLED